MTKDIDILVRREDLPRIKQAAESVDLEYRHTAAVDMLVQKGKPLARRAVHMIFEGEKVSAEYSEPATGIGEGRAILGIPVISVADLVKMKLTSFRAKDEAHINDLDEQGLITPEIEASLSLELRERLARAR